MYRGRSPHLQNEEHLGHLLGGVLGDLLGGLLPVDLPSGFLVHLHIELFARSYLFQILTLSNSPAGELGPRSLPFHLH